MYRLEVFIMHTLFRCAAIALAGLLAAGGPAGDGTSSQPNQRVYTAAASSENMSQAPESSCTYRLFDYGPGVANLSTGDNLSDYQWALKNEGRFRRIRSQLNLESLGGLYVHRNETGAVDAIALPRLEPGNFDKVTTEAVAGMDINISQAWELYDQAPSKRQTLVAVIDTGIDTSHPDLANAIWVNEDEIPGDGIDNDENGYIDDVNGWDFFYDNNQIYLGSEDDHGTHGAGTIAAGRSNGGMAGITDNQYVKLMVLKALGTENGMGAPEDIVEAIHYAEANGAVICNLSFGSTEYDESVAQAIQNSNMLFVVAAGNGDRYGNGYDIDQYPVYPASLPFDNVITVGNILFDGNLDESSNYGVQNVDLAAPGVYILSTVSNNEYGYMSGTSMAAPMVTGVAAMVYSSRPDLSVLGVKEVLLNSARRTEQLAGKVLTGGMLDAGAAMSYGQTG